VLGLVAWRSALRPGGGRDTFLIGQVELASSRQEFAAATAGGLVATSALALPAGLVPGCLSTAYLLGQPRPFETLAMLQLLG